jgi:hypothetical protein
VDPNKERQKQNPSKRYNISEKHCGGKRRRDRMRNVILREQVAIQNLLIQLEENLLQ